MHTLNRLMNLSGRRALVTGAAGKIGSVVSETLAELGADLILVDRPGTDFDPVTERVGGITRVVVSTIECDLEVQSDRQELINRISGDGAGLNILINNAAFVGDTNMTGWAVPFAKQTLDTWRRALELNLTAPFHLCQGLAALLGAAKGGSIINIASIYGEYAPDWRLYEGTEMGNPAAYAASKGGLIQITRWLSTTLAPDVRVNAISPGGVLRSQPEDFVKRYVSKTPLGRMATEDDFRGSVAYLASDLSGYVTGQILRVDGGWGQW
jgi:NAD(P)-dependent dehydrogenase (short-subunit alcohol dehydrogenase family)